YICPYIPLLAPPSFPTRRSSDLLAGAPAADWSHLFTGFVWNERALLSSPGSGIPPAKLPVLQNGVLAACDSQDGLKDGQLRRRKDRKSTRLNSSHLGTSYAVFCL